MGNVLAAFESVRLIWSDFFDYVSAHSHTYIAPIETQMKKQVDTRYPRYPLRQDGRDVCDCGCD